VGKNYYRCTRLANFPLGNRLNCASRILPICNFFNAGGGGGEVERDQTTKIMWALGKRQHLCYLWYGYNGEVVKSLDIVLTGEWTHEIEKGKLKSVLWGAVREEKGKDWGDKRSLLSIPIYKGAKMDQRKNLQDIQTKTPNLHPRTKQGEMRKRLTH